MADKHDDGREVFIILAIIIAILVAISMNTPTPDGPDCYDADPTQWTDIVCE